MKGEDHGTQTDTRRSAVLLGAGLPRRQRADPATLALCPPAGPFGGEVRRGRGQAGGGRPLPHRLPALGGHPLLRLGPADEILDLVEPLIGPDIAIFACHLLQKPPQIGKRVPWHEDSAYWKGRLDPIVVASITIALEPSTRENGCLEVLPG
ncbi:MAG: phytanoyl-CoA dioxygenase family protein, partial [Candidatus Handelsmanbacteria bacterium]|nr:phytanoyl-CoA dioxygenase family protein [Candidatus Handelsmanbacteria bacterium]